ncbi:MAG: Triosephosphate isomerase [Candidatus Dependentiae bacterium ADurb.Bin331]|nr:MAG: Triosephosphate isomerase [Candidatus Dependentiae bacterium ADurb.Bin331]
MKQNVQRFVVANWKMYFSHAQALNWIEKNSKMLQELQNESNVSIIVCPSADSLSYIAHKLKQTTIMLGSQNCSAHENGAYTGQIAAQSLSEIGCKWCIIGHSEVRTACDETDLVLQSKIERLFEHHLSPIFCVGEKQEEYQHKTAQKKLKEQLAPLQRVLERQHQSKTVAIAYEPLWSIGTGKVASNDYLQELFGIIEQSMEPYQKQHSFVLLYGGSVDEINAVRLWQIPQIAGFLVGKASTDFQLLKKIVLSTRG